MKFYRHMAALGMALAAALTLPAAGAQAAAAYDQDLFERDVRALTSTPHRLAGSEEGRRAGDYILEQLESMGYAQPDIVVQPFPVVQMARDPNDCYLEVDGRHVLLEPIRPNGLALPVTGADGIEGETIYVGGGRAEELAGKDVAGKIVVMDFTGGLAWMDVARVGAKAVIFVGPALEVGADPAKDNSTQWLSGHLPFVRMYISREDARKNDLFTPRHIRLFSRMSFVDVEGRNIILTIPGTDKPKGQDAADGMMPVVAMACAYDTFGPVPFISPSTRKAANVAGLLALARQFRRSPPSMTTALIFFDNNAQYQSGQMYFHFARTAEGAGDGENGQVAQMIRDRMGERGEATYLRQGLETLSRPYELIASAAGSQFTWRNWLPTLLTGVSLLAFVVLLIWFIVDMVRWRNGSSTAGLGTLLRLCGFIVAITIFGLLEAKIVNFSTIGLGQQAQAGTTRAFEFQALTKYLAQGYDDQRDVLTNLRLESLDLTSELRDAIKRMRGQVKAQKLEDGDPNAARAAEAALDSLLTAAAKGGQTGTSAISDTASSLPAAVTAADEAISRWKNSFQAGRARNGRFIDETHENLLQAARDYLGRGRQLEEEIEQVEQSRIELGEVRLAVQNKQLSASAEDPNTLSGQAQEKAAAAMRLRRQFEKIIAARRGEYQARLDEIEKEVSHLEAARQIGLAWSSRVIKAMLYLDIAPCEAPWAPTAPIADKDCGYANEPQMADFIHRWVDQTCDEQTCPHLARVPDNLLPEDEPRWSISAKAALLVPLANPGLLWPNQGYPTEAQADAAAYLAQSRRDGNFSAAT